MVDGKSSNNRVSLFATRRRGRTQACKGTEQHEGEGEILDGGHGIFPQRFSVAGVAGHGFDHEFCGFGAAILRELFSSCTLRKLLRNMLFLVARACPLQ